MYFPGKGHQYYKDVPYRQDNVANYLKADLLLAHHRVPISERGNNVQLVFHHAFAMVEVEVTLPEAETPIDGVFPRDAMEEVYMRDMLITYDVNYAEVISNDGLRTTRGLLEDDGGTRKMLPCTSWRTSGNLMRATIRLYAIHTSIVVLCPHKHLMGHITEQISSILW